MVTREYIEKELQKVSEHAAKTTSIYARKKDSEREEILINALRYLELHEAYSKIEKEIQNGFTYTCRKYTIEV